MSRGKNSKNRSGSKYRILAMGMVGAGLFIIGAVVLFTLPKPGSNVSDEPGDYASVVPVAVNFPAPALELSDLQGKRASLEAYRGQVVLINNWATWCPPCRAEMPTLQAYFQDHREQGFTLIGIEAGDPQENVAEFAKQYSLSFPIWLDPQNESLSGFYNASLPNSYVVDKEGTVVMGWTGAISRDMLEKHVTPLLED